MSKHVVVIELDLVEDVNDGVLNVAFFRMFTSGALGLNGRYTIAAIQNVTQLPDNKNSATSTKRTMAN